MAKTFQDIVDAVAEDIQDTDSQMKSIIGRYVNNRFRKILRATNFKVINYDYTVSVVSGTSVYTLPADYGKDVYCIDTTNKVQLEKISLGRMGADNPTSIDEAGSVAQYSIFRDDSDNIILKLYKTPTANITIALPYIVKIRTNMTSDDVPVNDFADLLELGATADAWRYKKQFSKARSLDVMFDADLDMYMWDDENQETGENKFYVTTDDYDRSYIG